LPSPVKSAYRQLAFPPISVDDNPVYRDVGGVSICIAGAKMPTCGITCLSIELYRPMHKSL
jgi:hypothetical protein